MAQRRSKRIASYNGLTDSNSDSDNENQINVIQHRNRRAICGTSESEAEEIEAHDNYFQLFVSEELVELIVRESNQYWSRKNNNNVNMSDGTVLPELYCFFAVTLLMTRHKKLSLAEYWSKDKLLRSDIFAEVMTRDRYFKLLQISPMMLTILMIVYIKYGTSLKYYGKHLMNHFSLINGYALTKVCFYIKGGFLLNNTYHQRETDLVPDTSGKKVKLINRQYLCERVNHITCEFNKKAATAIGTADFHPTDADRTREADQGTARSHLIIERPDQRSIHGGTPLPSQKGCSYKAQDQAGKQKRKQANHPS
ncbi:hypothetical protein ANTRET_LOCUS9554, partial [Anthophora retusa]